VVGVCEWNRSYKSGEESSESASEGDGRSVKKDLRELKVK
jgi:hypothetical protein